MSQVINQAFSDNEPTIIEVVIDPDQQTEPRTFTEILPNGKMLTAPMENLHPLIDEETLKLELDTKN
jgi:hypothetical protein